MTTQAGMNVVQYRPPNYRDRRSYRDGPKTVEQQIRANMERLSALLRVHFGTVPELDELKSAPKQYNIHDGDSYAFETRDCTPRFRCEYINHLAWADINAVTTRETVVPVTPGTQTIRGFLPREHRPRRTWISMYRHDDTYWSLDNGLVILVVAIPLQLTYVEDGVTRRIKAGETKPFTKVTWRWAVVMCEEVQWALGTADQVRAFIRATGVSPTGGGKRTRRMMMASERLQRLFLEDELDEAADDAWRWYREISDLHTPRDYEVPFDLELLYHAPVEDAGHGIKALTGPAVQAYPEEQE